MKLTKILLILIKVIKNFSEIKLILFNSTVFNINMLIIYFIAIISIELQIS